MDGIILINKEKQMSSHDVIAALRKILKMKKIGHCGTLDPMATGVLVCLLGKATKLSNYLVLDQKTYQATFQLGLATTTQDLEGEVVVTKPYNFEYQVADIERVLEQFKGRLIQTPSIYSAIKVNGKKLYEYARNNEDVVIPTREIEVFDLDLLKFENDKITINVKCSSGTYIRTLCYDIATKLGYPGVLTSLKRIVSGNYQIENCYTLEDIKNNNYQTIDLKTALQDYEMIEVNEETVNDIRNGKPLKIEMSQPFIVLYNDEVQALYDKTIDGQAKIIRGLW